MPTDVMVILEAAERFLRFYFESQLLFYIHTCKGYFVGLGLDCFIHEMLCYWYLVLSYFFIKGILFLT